MDKVRIMLAALVATSALATIDAHAIDPAYRKKLERSGCTQVSEMQGCDINKTRAENAKAGFVAPAATAKPAAAAKSPYAGRWLATNEGRTVATISIDNAERVTVNGKSVKAHRSDGALVFKDGMVTYTIQGDRRLKGEDRWRDSDAGTSGSIRSQ